ncbi:MAG: LysR substrate-binding domain-containing protein [Oscillospiraceae bacterium]
MDVKKLLYFIAIAEEKKISRAARRLYLSQPSLTQYLSQLEAEVGAKLFRRIGGEMILTQEGEYYLESARQVVIIQKNLYRRIHENTHHYTGELNVGMSPHRALIALPEVYSPFRRKYPDITLNLMEISPSANIEECVRNGKLDLGFVTPRETYNDLIYERFYEDFLVAAMHKSNDVYRSLEISPGSAVDLSLLKDAPYILSRQGSLITDNMEKFCQSKGMKSQSTTVYGFAPNSIQFMESVDDDMVFLMPATRSEPSEKLAFLRVKDSPTWHGGAIYHKSACVNAPMRDFIELMKRHFCYRLSLVNYV